MTPRRAIDEDLWTLRGCGKASVATFAERAGCTEVVARNRLNRLVAEGHATRWRTRGSTGYVYAITTPGPMQVLAGGRYRDRTPVTA
jgi:predicted ArsR family transcriptional regulator